MRTPATFPAGHNVVRIPSPELTAFVFSFVTWARMPFFYGGFGLPSLFYPMLGATAVLGVVHRVRLTGAPTVADGLRSTARTMLQMIGVPLLLMGVWLAASLATIFYAADTTGPVVQTSNLIAGMTPGVVALVLAVRRETLRSLNWGIVAGSSLLATLSLFQIGSGRYDLRFGGLAVAGLKQITPGQDDAFRIAGPFGDANYYGVLLLVSGMVAFGRVVQEPRRSRRLLGMCACVLNGSALLFTASRGAYLGLAICGVVAIALHRPPARLLAGGAVLGLGVLLIMPAGYRERFTNLNQLTADGAAVGQNVDPSLEGRTTAWQAGFEMFSRQPALGVGVGNFNQSYAEWAGRNGRGVQEGLKPHGLYVELLATRGLVGTLLFGALIGAIASMLRFVGRSADSPDRWQRQMAEIAGLVIIAYLIPSMFLHAEHTVLFWLAIAPGLALPGIDLLNAPRAVQPSVRFAPVR